MTRNWQPDLGEDVKRRRLLEFVERGEALVVETEELMRAAEKKAKPYIERARQASRRHYDAREQLLEDRAELAALLHDEAPQDHSVAVR